MKEISSIDELKVIELDIMKKIHRFCVDNNIIYYLCYGTLIGAIRHKGFIPWDDDIDILMPRPDYERFLKLFPRVQKQLGLEVVNHKTKTYFGRPMSKVIDKRTDLFEPEFKGDDHIGVFVDVWPLDGAANSKKERNKTIDKCYFWRSILYSGITKMKHLKSAKYKLAHVFTQFIPRGN